MNQLLDAIAKAVLDVFELSAQPANIKEENESSGAASAMKKRADASTSTPSGSKAFPQLSISLIAPLVARLPGNVQGRILKVASQVMWYLVFMA